MRVDALLDEQVQEDACEWRSRALEEPEKQGALALFGVRCQTPERCLFALWPGRHLLETSDHWWFVNRNRTVEALLIVLTIRNVEPLRAQPQAEAGLSPSGLAHMLVQSALGSWS